MNTPDNNKKEETKKQDSEPTEKVEKKPVENSAIPQQKIKWGSNTLGGGLKTSAFKSTGLFGSLKKTDDKQEEKKETTEKKKESISLKWGSGKTNLLEKVKVQPVLIQQTPAENEDKKDSVEKEDIAFQMRVKVYLLEDNEYKPRGKGNLRIIRFTISFWNETKYQIVLRREGEEGGLGTVLVFNSLLYKSTPIKDMGNGFVLITLPSTEGKMISYLMKPISGHSVSELKQGIENIIASI